MSRAAPSVRTDSLVSLSAAINCTMGYVGSRSCSQACRESAFGSDVSADLNVCLKACNTGPFGMIHRTSAGDPQPPGGLGRRGHLADGQRARYPAQPAVRGDLQLLGIPVLKAGPDPLDDVLGRLRVVRLDVDKTGGQDAVAVPLADQVDLGHLAGAELKAEAVHVGVEQRGEQPAVGPLGVRQPAERPEADMHDERAAGDPVHDLVDGLDQVLRRPVLGGVRGGQRLLDLNAVAAGRHQPLDVGADGRDEGVRAVAAVAVDGAEVQLRGDAVRPRHADLGPAVRAGAQEFILAGEVPDRLDLVERLPHLVDGEHVPADRAEPARRGPQREAGHLAGDPLDPAAAPVLAVGEDVEPGVFLVADGEPAVVVEELGPVRGPEPPLLIAVGHDIPPAGPRPAAGGGDRQRRRVAVVTHDRPLSELISSAWMCPLLAITSARSVVSCGRPSKRVSVPPASSRMSWPATMSQASMAYSQYASRRPAAIAHSVSAGEPSERTPPATDISRVTRRAYASISAGTTVCACATMSARPSRSAAETRSGAPSTVAPWPGSAAYISSRTGS